MTEERLELRIDPEHRRKLGKIAETRGATLSYTVRQLIDDAYEDAELEERLHAVERITNANVEDMPDPDELSRQLANRYGDLSDS